MSGGDLILGIEIELNLHVVGIAEKHLPAGTVRHLADKGVPYRVNQVPKAI